MISTHELHVINYHSPFQVKLGLLIVNAMRNEKFISRMEIIQQRLDFINDRFRSCRPQSQNLDNGEDNNR